MTPEYDARILCLPNNRRIAILKDGVWWCSICNRRLVEEHGPVRRHCPRCTAYDIALNHFNGEHRR